MPENNKDILITGIHRSGTTLVCRLLLSLDNVVALQEPIKVTRLAGLDSAEKKIFIREFIEKARFELLHFHETRSRFSKDAVTDNYFPDEPSLGGLRITKEENGAVTFSKPLSEDFSLVIKHNAAFTALLDELYPTFNCFAIVRNPLALLASWQTVDMAVNKGRMPVAEALDSDFSNVISSIDSVLDRQIFILNWFFEKYTRTLPSANIIRYEDIISSEGKQLSKIIPGASLLNESLSSRNANPIYNSHKLPEIVEKLLYSEGFWQQFYSKDEIEKLADSLLGINWLPASNLYGQYCVPAASAHRPVSQRILGGSIHEPDTIEFIRKNCGDGDVVHAGTFFGDFLPGISTALSPGAKIWAFEPNYENYYCAQKTIRANSLQNTELRHAALGETETKVHLLIRACDGKNLGGCSRITDDNIPDSSVEVRLVSVDQTIPPDRKISVIQLDIEGYEKHALSGALGTISRNKPVIIIEDNNRITETDWFKLNILSLGYKITGRVHNNYIISCLPAQ